MKIIIKYSLYTDGDYSLMDYNDFGCTDREIEIDDEYFDYLGNAEFDNNEIWRCKHDSKNFLTKLLCDGIHVSYTHYYLIKYFYDVIESLIDFINKNDSGEICKSLSGNYEGTRISVEIQN